MQQYSFKENIQPLSNREFENLSRFIYDQVGIKMPSVKKTMLETRLRKRLRATGFESFSTYCDFLFSPKGISEELIHMIDVVTTNKTDFFREPAQFTFMSQVVLPEMANKYGAGTDRRIKIWSAGCSTGEEPYTIGIVLNEFGKNISHYSYSILATDISTRVLETAITGVYSMDRIECIPIHLKKNYFLKSKDPQKSLVRVVPALRRNIIFQRLNFMDNDLGMPLGSPLRLDPRAGLSGKPGLDSLLGRLPRGPCCAPWRYPRDCRGARAPLWRCPRPLRRRLPGLRLSFEGGTSQREEFFLGWGHYPYPACRSSSRVGSDAARA